MADDQPLTCVRCWHAPASRLLVIRWRTEQNMRLLCTDCAVKDEVEAPGLPGFRGLTVLVVWPEHGTATEWGVRRQGEAVPYASGAEGGVRRMAAAGGHLGAPLDVVQRQVTPWVPAPGEDGNND